MADDPQRLVRLGKVTRAHGIRGEVTVRPDQADSSSLFAFEEVFLKASDGEPERVKIDAARTAHESWLVRFAGCLDRTAAERLAGREVLVPRESLPPPGEGEFYADDLVGLEVRSADGQVLGKVVRLFDAGAVPVLEIEGPRSFQVPLVDTFVRKIDVAAGVVEVEAPEEE
ncbi:MAG: 16S rRNA processing protein RimM [Deltaproteobacteria bacterium]|nr:16S rRNA processing protein RimM [Deltaproteobacteria bacterium]